MRNTQNGDCTTVVGSFEANWDTHTKDQTCGDICCLDIFKNKCHLVGTTRNGRKSLGKPGNTHYSNQIESVYISERHESQWKSVFFIESYKQRTNIPKMPVHPTTVSSDSSSVAPSGTARRVGFMLVPPWGNPKPLTRIVKAGMSCCFNSGQIKEFAMRKSLCLEISRMLWHVIMLKKSYYDVTVYVYHMFEIFWNICFHVFSCRNSNSTWALWNTRRFIGHLFGLISPAAAPSKKLCTNWYICVYIYIYRCV